MNPPSWPFQIVAAGLLAQNLGPGSIAGNTVGAKVVRGSDGSWEITAYDETLNSGNCALILSPGPGSNVAGGISFGQSSQSGNVFLFTSYRNSTGLAFDVPVQFMIVKWPDAAEGPSVTIIP